MANTNSMTLLGKSILTSATDYFEFASIPQTYTDLYLRLSVRSSTTSGNSNLIVILNGVTGTSYSWYYGYGNGSTITRGTPSSQPWFDVNPIINNEDGTWATNSFSLCNFWIGNYTNTTWQKGVSAEYASTRNTTSGIIGGMCGTWGQTSAITNIQVNGTGNFVTGSAAYLYGVMRTTATVSV